MKHWMVMPLAALLSVLVHLVTVTIVLCISNRSCPTTPPRVVQTDGGITVHFSELLDEKVVYEFPDAGADDTDGGAK